ncbi:hypothetical protein [Halorhabdus sp. CBA1104]|uniref:hypothetical protein n=1 Tax=Halorhabdus sp. CBA1104 TaxID=1380432 RepID=UPI001E4300C1|nr:hypothetical protein [Halorhabdus sp. CBA1104]
MPSRFNNDADSTIQTTQSRRRFLLGMGTLTAALAGCSGDTSQQATEAPTDNTTDDGPTDETPVDDSPTETFDPAGDLPYGQWLTRDNRGLFFAYANLDNLPDDTVADSGGSSDRSVDDPLALYPLVLGGAAVGIGRLSLSYVGLAQAINPRATSDSTVNELTITNETIIAEGSFATDQLHDRLIESTDETFGIAYEQTSTERGYDRYEPVDVPDSVDDPPAVAVTDETVIAGPDASRLDQTIATDVGNRSRIFETDEAATALLEQAGTGDLVVGQFGAATSEQLFGDLQLDPGPQFRPRSGENVVAAVDFDASSDTFEAQFALDAADLGEGRQETIETSFGTAAVDDSESIDVSDGRLIASGTYSVESLGLTSADSAGDEQLSEAAAAELVAPDALTFQYEPQPDQQFGELWVTITEETDAAAIRLDTDTGNSTEIRPQEGSISNGDSISVPVDQDGDAVTVSVLNDEGAVGKLTTQSVPTAELSEETASKAVPEDALSFTYDSPDGGEFGSLTIEVVADTDAETLIAQPQEAPGLFADRVGSLGSHAPIDVGTTLETAVEPAGEEVIVYATVDGATGVVARWQGPT